MSTEMTYHAATLSRSNSDPSVHDVLEQDDEHRCPHYGPATEDASRVEDSVIASNAQQSFKSFNAGSGEGGHLCTVNGSRG
ncbi:hypothetical protein LTR35_017487, partial [Friedmanniomyces endolithicus]